MRERIDIWWSASNGLEAPGGASAARPLTGSQIGEPLAPMLASQESSERSDAEQPKADQAAPQSTSVAKSTTRLHGAQVEAVWREVRKRVFLKLAFSTLVADALAAAVPIAIDGDRFVIGFDHINHGLEPVLSKGAPRNVIENILRGAAGRSIYLEVIEGITIQDWEIVRDRREKATDAMVAMAEQMAGTHHYEDVLNQIVGEVRQQVTSVHDRVLPQVRAGLILDIAPSLADAEDMLFDGCRTREAQRAVSRMVDRIAGFLEVPPITLAIEIERARRDPRRK